MEFILVSVVFEVLGPWKKKIAIYVTPSAKLLFMIYEAILPQKKEIYFCAEAFFLELGLEHELFSHV